MRDLLGPIVAYFCVVVKDDDKCFNRPMVTILVALVMLSILVMVHEFGHFIVARWAGIGVEEFALGLPFTKPIWTLRLRSGFNVSLYPILFGGFVKLVGEDSNSKAKNAFGQKSVWKRMAVVVAGVVMNLLLAIVIFYIFLFLSGFKVLVPKLADYKFVSPTKTSIVISYVQDPSPAKTANLVPGDVVLEANGKRFEKLADFQKYTREVAAADHTLNLKTTDILFEMDKNVVVAPRKNPPEGQGPLGVGISEALVVDYQTLGWKVGSGIVFSYDMFAYNLVTLKSFITTAAKTGNGEPLRDVVSGPVGMVSIIGDILGLPTKAMMLSLLNITALISLSLMFMNILPIPAMDGGRMVFLLIEAVTKRKLPAIWENRVNQAGLVLLLGFMAVIMFNDVAKIVTPWLPKK